MSLLSWIITGAVGGILAGWWAGPAMVQTAWLGQLFLDLLKMLIVPLIVAAVITGIASIGDIRALGRIGRRTLLYYLSTTGIAVAIGLVVVNVLSPGAGMTPQGGELPAAVGREIGIAKIVGSLIHPNIIDAAATTNLLPLIVFSIALAAALTTLGERGRGVISFFDGLNEAMMKLVMWVMYLAPGGIFFLVASRLGEAGGGPEFFAELSAVGWLVVTVLLGLGLHFGVLLLILVLFAGRGLAYLTTMMRALITAFGTASSSATLPLTMECSHEAGVDERAIRFVLPVGSTVNMDGTALYESVAAMFIAQVYGATMGFGDQMIIFLTATLAAIGAAGIPQAGLVTMVIVLNAVELPVEGIALLLTVDWFLDRFRTAVNVWGDAVGAAVVSRLFDVSDVQETP